MKKTSCSTISALREHGKQHERNEIVMHPRMVVHPRPHPRYTHDPCTLRWCTHDPTHGCTNGTLIKTKQQTIKTNRKIKLNPQKQNNKNQNNQIKANKEHKRNKRTRFNKSFPGYNFLVLVLLIYTHSIADHEDDEDLQFNNGYLCCYQLLSTRRSARQY